MEIYNEEIRDLLQKPRNQRSLEIKERFDIGVYVKDLTSVAVSTADQCFQIMQFGTANSHFYLYCKWIDKIILILTGQTGQTAMNEQSSRSHAIFTLIIECSEKIADDRTLFRLGKLHLVDLAVNFCFCIIITVLHNFHFHAGEWAPIKNSQCRGST